MCLVSGFFPLVFVYMFTLQILQLGAHQMTVTVTIVEVAANACLDIMAPNAEVSRNFNKLKRGRSFLIDVCALKIF